MNPELRFPELASRPGEQTLITPLQMWIRTGFTIQ